MVENPPGERGPGRDLYVGLGRGEMRAGRSLDALLAAYRLGARVAWRRLAAAGEGGRVAPGTRFTLPVGVFAFLFGVFADSILGYLRAGGPPGGAPPAPPAAAAP